jgi:hypothetical protein
MRVVQLTQEALKVQCKVDDFGEWGAPTLDLPQYQRKEELQRATRFSQLGSIFWTLVEDDGQELQAGRTELLCHCRFDCVVAPGILNTKYISCVSLSSKVFIEDCRRLTISLSSTLAWQGVTRCSCSTSL